MASSENQTPSSSSRALGLVLFCLRFVVIAGVCFYVWWAWLSPHYAWVIGQAGALGINLFESPPIEAMEIEVDPEGILNSEIFVVYKLDGHEPVFPIGDLINSPVTYVALVLATWRMSFRRRTLILTGGLAFYFAGQSLYITAFYLFREQLARHREIGIVIGQFWLTLPFVMWIVLAYWERLGALFIDKGSVERNE